MTTTTIPADTSTAPLSVQPSSAQPSSAQSSSAQSLRVTQGSLARAEWIKFISVRSNFVTLVAAGVVLVLFGTLFSSLAGSEEGLPPNATAGTDSLSMSFGGMNLSQLMLGVLGAVFVAGEYATGMIRTMFATVGHRIPVMQAKAIVLGGSTWVVMTVASFAVFFAGQAAYAGDGITFEIGDPGVVRALLGGGVYGAGIVLMGLALGFLIRSAAAAIGTLVGALMIAPGLAGLLPDAVSESVGKFLPSNAGQAFMNVTNSETLLSPAAGFAVFVAWVVVLLGAAAVILELRDA